MKNRLLTLILLLSSSIALSQNYIDLVKFDYAISPQNNFDTSAVSTGLQEMNGDLTLPIVINDNTTLLTGITFERTTASFNPSRSKESLTGLTLKLGTNIKHGNKWSGTYLLLPKISSDLKKVTNHDFQLGGVALMKYKKTDRINYKFGVYANSELFSTFIVPIIGFYYLSPSDKFEAKVLLPLSVDLNYSITKSARIGLNFKGQIRTYHLNTPIQNETDRYVARSTNDVYIYFQYSVRNGINFKLGVGRSIGRSYRIYSEQVSFAMPLAYFGDNRTQLNTDFSDSWLLKFSAAYRLNF